MVRSTPDFTGFCFSIFRRPQSTVFDTRGFKQFLNILSFNRFPFLSSKRIPLYLLLSNNFSTKSYKVISSISVQFLFFQNRVIKIGLRKENEKSSV